MSAWLAAVLGLATMATLGLMYGWVWLAVWYGLPRVDGTWRQWPTTEWEWGRLILCMIGAALLLLGVVTVYFLRDSQRND